MEYIPAALLTLALVSPAMAYPQGAPGSACEDMFPVGHKVNAKTSTAPYVITVSSNSYANNANINVTLAVVGTGYYEGVFIQARRAKCDKSHTEALGTYLFQSYPLKTLDCGTKTGNALTHSDKSKKRLITFTWVPPSTSEGTIYFRGTFVKETDEFWTTVSSDFINDGRTTGETPTKCAVRTSGAGKFIAAHSHYILCFGVFLISLITSSRMA